MSGKRQIVTVDGVGASGKSALSRLLAERLGFGHLNSGLLYRAAGCLVLKEREDARSAEAVLSVMDRHSIRLERGPTGGSVIRIDGSELSDRDLTAPEVSEAASRVAQHQLVRDRFIDAQRTAFMPDGVVAEGRDMGTIIFPDADVKFFVDARLDVRAQRRYEQLKGTPQEAPLEAIKQALAERDHRDANRDVAPMKPAAEAVIVDNSDAPLEETVQSMLAIVLAKTNRT